MDWLWWHRRPNLDGWRDRPYSPGIEAGPRAGDYRDNHERVVTVEEPGSPQPDGVFRRLADAIFRFDVFPPRLAGGVLQHAPIDLGDAVGICYRLLPGCRLFFAARVYERFDGLHGDLWRAGFSYRTLAGHPECGEETFCVEKHVDTGQIVVALRSWSRPAHWMARLGYLLTRRWQLQAGKAALDHLQQIANQATSCLATAAQRVC